ncbi:heavy metal translocating P-type ATPase [Hydrogenothermus marinus]|uniref:heavy metal translocating P-type ATPase n=1 Tax=Hydrogenothermus marinus TaxID=133270 RepID=UPI0024824C70|nr:copper-translocating P-type ATPase [Hydrogenothermus marinus]
MGWEFYKTSIYALKRKIADMNLLVAIGTSAAYFYSVIVLFFPDLIPKAKNTYFESAAAIITFILIGRYLETKARNKATSFMKSLLKLKPEKATILVDGKEIEIPAENIVKGDIVVLKAGDKVAVDGIIIEGGCELDQSAITGESLPVFKSENENVISGSIVKNGYCKIKAITSGADNTINHIIKLILEAQSKKPKIAKLADKIVSYFVPSILIIAIFTFDIWYFFTENITVSLIPAVSVLIIACPCALGLATPIAVVSVVGRAAKEGVLIKNPEVLEIIDKVKSVIFDKTGTLTKASLKVVNFKFENPEYKDLAYNLSLKTNHPISKAIVEGLKSENDLKIENIEYIVGKGIKAYWQNKPIYLGNLSLLEENNINLSENYKKILNKEIEKGRTVIFLATNDKVLGYISLEDEIREEAKEVIKWLKENGYKVYMLTGDNEKTAKNVAKIVGIENVFSNVLPEYKLKIVKSLQEKGEKVIFVGDGINDAPSLSEADIGIAIGGKGSQLAKESGDVILLSDSLKAVIKFIKLSKIGKTTIKQNLFWAYVYNIIGIPIAAGILYPINGLLLRPIFASIAMSLSSITVVLNALRIKVIKL